MATLVECFWQLATWLFDVIWKLNEEIGFDGILVLVLIVGFIGYSYVVNNRFSFSQTIHPAFIQLVEDFRNVFLPRRRNSATNGDPKSIPNQPFNIDRECPICFGEASHPVMTNCGHLFCCSCLIGYWKHAAGGHLINPVRCAVCRATVTVLLPIKWSADVVEEGSEAAQWSTDLNDYNMRFSRGTRPFMDYVRDLPVLVPYLARQMITVDGLVLMFRMRMLLCIVGVVIYILCPVDFIPESVFGVIGIVDDLFIAFVVLIYVCIAFRQMMADRGQQFFANVRDAARALQIVGETETETDDE
ncbi:hypothetical protein QR680_000160 [Steinernema hermaphroditum]|uniref:E3 ubiquitin-protein ligase RNF170 n=1 Tax=Steinernema hermaphroditum TaxID=289476 RepID=A0AA39GTM9_9BILA|nr:hypothetical protein QR680_000160 [Steinernema hermaphroditum]